MPLHGNTYLVTAAAATALDWPGGAQISQIRILAIDTSARVMFHLAAGTPVFEWKYNIHSMAGVQSSQAISEAHHTIPMGGVRFQVAWIPSILTACTAWIDFK